MQLKLPVARGCLQEKRLVRLLFSKIWVETSLKKIGIAVAGGLQVVSGV
jgi:hypothetical protein